MKRLQADIQSIVDNKDLFISFTNSSVLVTGATGFIGSMIIRSFVAANERYGLGIKIFGQIRDYRKAEAIFGNLINQIELTTTDNVETEFIIHTVSPTTSKYFIEKPVETIKASVETTMSILEVARKNKASMVYLSSMEQYGIPYEPNQRMTEEKIGVINHLNIRSSYSEAKRLCECLCASYATEYGISVKIARLAQTMGAGIALSDNRMPMQFARAVVEKHDIVLHTEGKSLSNFVYITDAITGILLILRKGVMGEAYNVCNDQETKSVREIAEMVSNDISNNKIKVKVEILNDAGYAPDVAMYLDSGKLKNLGWIAKVDMKEAYRRLTRYIDEIS